MTGSRLLLRIKLDRDTASSCFWWEGQQQEWFPKKWRTEKRPWLKSNWIGLAKVKKAKKSNVGPLSTRRDGKDFWASLST